MSDVTRFSDPAIHEEIRLAPYDDRWPLQFADERERLRTRFAHVSKIEHVGSTAVPGLQAKPIIDILAGVESMAVADRLFEPLLAHGYTTSREFNATLADRRWFMRSANGRRTHHLHVVVAGDPTWTQWLRFRDVLRADGVLAQQYGALKAELAAKYRHDREAYTHAKSEFVAAAIAAHGDPAGPLPGNAP